jgi:endonuclease YncB( thermonuclease family)
VGHIYSSTINQRKNVIAVTPSILSASGNSKGGNVNAIKKFWGQGLINKIIMVSLPFLGLCMCCYGASLLPDTPASAPAPTFDANSMGTMIVQTAIAAHELTSQANQPTITPSPTSDIPKVALATETATESQKLIPLPTSTLDSLIPISGISCVPNTAPQTGKVVDVVDGDTIKVMLDDGLIYSVRYIGMDTPENTTEVEYYGAQAFARNSEMVYKQTVTLYRDVSEVDKYGRLLRYVFTGDDFVNYELVAEGYAEAKEYPPDTSCATYFSSAQQAASAASLGIWAAPTPQLIAPTSEAPSRSPGNAVCTCSSNTYNCKDFSSRSSAQACFDYCLSVGAGDVHRLDSDSDGRVCESMQ